MLTASCHHHQEQQHLRTPAVHREGTDSTNTTFCVEGNCWYICRIDGLIRSIITVLGDSQVSHPPAEEQEMVSLQFSVSICFAKGSKASKQMNKSALLPAAAPFREPSPYLAISCSSATPSRPSFCFWRKALWEKSTTWGRVLRFPSPSWHRSWLEWWVWKLLFSECVSTLNVLVKLLLDLF